MTVLLDCCLGADFISYTPQCEPSVLVFGPPSLQPPMTTDDWCTLVR